MKSFDIGPRKTRVFYLHGLRGHGLSQEASLEHIAKNLGVDMTSLEMEGHGKDSVVRHCLVPRYQKTVNDICDFIKRHSIKSEQVVLMGHSFGAALMILAACKLDQDPSFKPKVAGIVGISTAFDVGHNVSKWKLWLSGAIGPISRYLFENSSRFSSILTIHEMDIDLISADPTVVRAIADDELVYKGRIPLATSAQVYRAGLQAKAKLKKSDLKCVLLHSKDDAIALAPKEGDFGSNVTLKLFEQLRHNCIDGVSREVFTARRLITRFIVDKL